MFFLADRGKQRLGESQANSVLRNVAKGGILASVLDA